MLLGEKLIKELQQFMSDEFKIELDYQDALELATLLTLGMDILGKYEDKLGLL